MSGALLLICVALVALSLMMISVWVASRAIHNYGLVDVAWALGFTLAAALYAYVGRISNGRQWAIILMMALWSLRLAWHLGVRFKHWYPSEDPRYTALKKKMGSFADAKMLLVFIWQAAILTFMTTPIAVAVTDSRSQFGPLQFLAIIIWLVALSGESVADYQLSRFSKDPNNKGRTCQQGLWRYCRHPNYFFEWLGAVSFFVYASDSPYGFWTILCPLLYLYLLLNVSGVKPAEEHSKNSRSDYADYIKTTSAFVPWFRRRSS
jgi:steroid 5-alpha reductase family enzyme